MRTHNETPELKAGISDDQPGIGEGTVRAGHDFEVAKDVRLSQSLERALAILQYFTAERRLLGIKELAEGLGMSPSTVHRYAISLVEFGWLEQPHRSDRKYRLGLRPTAVGMRAVKANSLYKAARSSLEELRRTVSYTVGYAAREGEHMVYLDWLQGFRGSARLGLSLGPGSRLPIDCTSLGKVLLADLPLGQREVIVDGLTLAPSEPDATSQRDLLLEELVTVRATGYAVSSGEPEPEVQAIAAPVRDKAGAVAAAVTVIAPKSMVGAPRLTHDFLPQLLATTDQISAALGFPLNGSPAVEGAE